MPVSSKQKASKLKYDKANMSCISISVKNNLADAIKDRACLLEKPVSRYISDLIKADLIEAELWEPDV